jgi:ubiquitin-protein ligase
MALQRLIKIVNAQINAYEMDKTHPVKGLKFIRDETDVKKIKFLIKCMDDSDWKDKTLTGEIDLPESYPFQPPKIRFTCNLYHPNVYTDGRVCLSILNSQPDQFGYFTKETLWSPACGLDTVMLSIWNVLLEPNLESPANLDACIDYRKNKESYVMNMRNQLQMPGWLAEYEASLNDTQNDK